MQMRLTGIAGTADARHQLAAPHAVPYLHTQTSRLQVHVISKLTATQVERDCVSRNCFQRNRHSRVERFAVSRDVIGEAISCRDNTAVGKRPALLSHRNNRSARPARRQKTTQRP